MAFALPFLAHVRIYGRGIACLVGLWVAALATAPMVAWYSLSDPGRAFDAAAMIRDYIRLGSGLVWLLTLLWGARRLGLRITVRAFSLGVLAEALADPSAWQDNAWKYALAWPVAMVALTWRDRRGAVILLVIAAVSVYFDYRSFAGVTALAALLVLWRSRRREMPGVSIRWLVALVAPSRSSSSTPRVRAALHGYLGVDAQLRTISQTANGQSLLLGARPESAAAVALFKQHPLGYGPGVVLGLHHSSAGIAAMGSQAANSLYVRNYVFADVAESLRPVGCMGEVRPVWSGDGRDDRCAARARARANNGGRRPARMAGRHWLRCGTWASRRWGRSRRMLW